MKPIATLPPMTEIEQIQNDIGTIGLLIERAAKDIAESESNMRLSPRAKLSILGLYNAMQRRDVLRAML